MATAEEKFRGVTGDTMNRRIQYVVRNATDDADAINTVIATAPSQYNNIPMSNVEVEELAFHLGLFLCTAVYSSESSEKPETDDIDISFDVALTTQHITQSISTVNRYVNESNPFMAVDETVGGRIGTDHKNKNPEGVDIRVPVGSFQITWYAPTASITSAYRKTLMETVGKVNNTAFYGHAAGEVLFVGASGRSRTEDDWEITYTFEVNPNRTDVKIAEGTDNEINVDEVDGWDVLWVHYEEIPGNEAIEYIPSQACVERVYYRADFSTVLGI